MSIFKLQILLLTIWEKIYCCISNEELTVMGANLKYSNEYIYRSIKYIPVNLYEKNV